MKRKIISLHLLQIAIAAILTTAICALKSVVAIAILGIFGMLVMSVLCFYLDAAWNAFLNARYRVKWRDYGDINFRRYK